jgi:sortase A
MRRLARITGTLLIVAGVGTLAWAAAVWQWEDPFTAVVTKLEQRGLEQEFERSLERRRTRAPTEAADDRAGLERRLAREAKAWRRELAPGDAVARLRIPSLGVDEILVNGTDTGSLKRGPGRYLKSALPGEGELMYVAGHRTTYGAPFSRIDRLQRGDRVIVELPYATYEYAITGHRIVAATELSVLRSKGYEQLALQACHPRFFASHRYIAYARPVSVRAAGPGEATLALG